MFRKYLLKLLAVKFLPFIIFLFAFVTTCFGQRTKDIEGIFKKVTKGEGPASFYLKDFYQFDSKDKRYNLALYLLHKAYAEKAANRESTTPYKTTASYYDSAIYFLDRCKRVLDEGKFSKHLDLYLPMVNDYGIYESEEQLKQDLYAIFNKEIKGFKASSATYRKLDIAFKSVVDQYTNVVEQYQSLQSEYPTKDDILILAKEAFTEELANLKMALSGFERALSIHKQVLEQHGISPAFPTTSVTVSNYRANLINADAFRKTGRFSAISDWIKMLEVGRVEKLGDFWSELFEIHQLINKNIALLSNGKTNINTVEVPKGIYEKIKFIDPSSSAVPYLNYLELKQHFLHKKITTSSRGYHTLIQLYSILQQIKLSHSILEKRLNDTALVEKDAVFFEKINKQRTDLQIFVDREGAFLDSENREISRVLKDALVDDFLAGKFNPNFAKYQDKLIPLYEQKADVIKEGQAITTSVLKIDENKRLLGGTIMDGQAMPYVALVENEQIVWLQQNVLPQNALSFADDFEYYHCAALFETNKGWGGVYYPGKFNENTDNNKQSGLLVLFDAQGKRQKMFPLPVMQRLDVACYYQGLGGYAFLAENAYLSSNYRNSEILLIDYNGEVKWKKTLPVKSFASSLKATSNGIFLFANSIEKKPGEQHHKSEVHVFELNKDGVVMKDRALGFYNSSYATQVLQDEQNNWLIFGFKGNSDLYNLRHKDVFYYMLDQSFDAVSGGELTSTEKP